MRSSGIQLSVIRRRWQKVLLGVLALFFMHSRERMVWSTSRKLSEAPITVQAFGRPV